jgi:hypothetical protein
LRGLLAEKCLAKSVEMLVERLVGGENGCKRRWLVKRMVDREDGWWREWLIERMVGGESGW